MNKTFAMILGFLFLTIVGFSGWLFIKSLLKADPNITASVIGAIAVVGAGIWSHYSTKRLEINSRHFIEKKNAYIQFIELIFEFFKEIKKEKNFLPINKPPLHENKDIQVKILNFKKELMVWGNHEVILALENFESHTNIDNTNEILKEQASFSSLLIVDDLLRAIRKDLGHNDSPLKRGHLIGLLLIVQDREKILSYKNIKETS